MQGLVLGTICIVTLAALVYRRSGGIATLPFMCFAYLILLYIGAVDFYLRVGTETWLHVIACGAAFTAGVFVVRERPSFVDEKKAASVPLSFSVGVHPQILSYTLGFLSVISVVVSLVLLSSGEIPLFQIAVSSAMVKLTKGPVGHLLVSLGYDNLSLCALGWYVLFTIRKKRVYLIYCVVCLLLMICFGTLVGTKVAGFTSLIWLLLGVSYLYRRKIKLQTYALMAAFAIPVSIWATSYYIRWEAGTDPIGAVWRRMTIVAVQPLDFVISVWVARFGHLGGQSFITEISRIIANATGAPQPVLFNEYIWGFLNSANPYISTGLSSSLSLYGTAYANFGLAGGIIIVALFGFICQFINVRLLSGRSRHFLLYAAYLYLMFQLIFTCWIAGMPIIALQTFLIAAGPKIILFLMVYKFFSLPFRIPLKWTPHSWKGKVPMASPEALAGMAGSASGQAAPPVSGVLGKSTRG